MTALQAADFRLLRIFIMSIFTAVSDILSFTVPIVVSGVGKNNRDWISSKPTMATSSGTFKPRLLRA
jgi:hypothetical protein